MESSTVSPATSFDAGAGAPAGAPAAAQPEGTGPDPSVSANAIRGGGGTAADEESADEEAAPLWVVGPRWRPTVAVVAGLVIACGVVLRFWARSPLWLDEALTVDIARLPLSHLHAALREDGAPPLYYVLLHFWMRIFGSSDAATRALSGVISVATLPVVWVAGRRFAGTSLAWSLVVLIAAAPFAVYYGTEVRMYSLVMLLTACGFVAVDRALQRPRPGNLVAVAACVCGLLYTQYWSLYLMGALGIWLIWQSWRGLRARRRQARAVLAAVVAGGLTFVPWLPTFVFQARHTGTPWSAPANLTAMLSAVTGFTVNQATLSSGATDQSRLLAIVYFVLAFLGLFGLARDRRHVSIDVRTRRRGRPLAFVVVFTLLVAVAGGVLSGSAFSSRYPSVVFVPFLLLVALGAMTLADPRIRMGLLAVATAAALLVSFENISTERTQAGPVAAVLQARAQPGDVVAYCPDQLGPAVYRLTSGLGNRQITFPRDRGPSLVNWVDYSQAVARGHPARFTALLERLAGPAHRIWLVWAGGYQGYSLRCEAIEGDLGAARGMRTKTWVKARPNIYYEPMSLNEFSPPGAGGGAGQGTGGQGTGGRGTGATRRRG